MYRQLMAAVCFLFLASVAIRADDKKTDDKPKPTTTDDKKKTDDKKTDEKKTTDDKKKVDDKKVDDKKPDVKTPEAKTAYTAHDGYYEKNTSGLTGPSSYLVFTKADAFEKVFAAVPPGKDSKSKPIAKDTFDSKLVVAGVRRGNALFNYEYETIAAAGDTLTVRYRVIPGQFQGATYASPFILSVDKGSIKKVVFVENGNTVATVDVK